MDFAFINQGARKARGEHIAIIGAGIAGLSSAGYLATAGYAVTVFERLSVAGGLMTYGIPEWRIPLENVQRGVDRLHNEFGVQFEFNTKIVHDNDEESTIGDILVHKKRTLVALREEYSAVLIATGAWGERSLGLEGEELQGVYSGIDFLYRVRAQQYDKEVEHISVQGKRVVIIGAGFTAIDVATRAMQLGASSVSLVYRRTSKEAPAGLYEITHAVESGAKWIERHTPVAVQGTTHVEAMTFHDANTDSNVDIACDIVLKAVGDIPLYPDMILCQDIAKNKDYSRMRQEKVYLAGDALIGASKLGKAARNGMMLSRMLITDFEYGRGSWYFNTSDIAL